MWVHPKFVLNFEIIKFIISQVLVKTETCSRTNMYGTARNICTDGDTKVWAGKLVLLFAVQEWQ